MTAAELASVADVQRIERKLDQALALLTQLRPPEYVSIEETRQRLGGIDRATVRAMIERGQLVARQAGRRVLISVESIREAR